MKILKNDLKKVPILIIGFILLSFGMVLTLKSGLGMSPWGVFHTGLVKISDINLGDVTQLLGLLILSLSVIFVKTKIGIGTILNIVVIGSFINFFVEKITYIPDSNYTQFGLLFIGLIFMTFGRALYISTKLGAGPRDGLFVGLSGIFNVEVKYVKPAIELTVLLLGYLLGGEIGYGTIILSLSSGYLVQRFFKILGYDPRIDKQGGIVEYFLFYENEKTSN